MAAANAQATEKHSCKQVSRQLSRICASATFRGAGRLRRFLEFIVAELLAGRQDEIKEYVVGAAVFDKTAAFDPRTDPIVRVQARRLRALLERYYREEAGPDELVIDLPKGGYFPVISARRAAAPKTAWAVALANRNTVAVAAMADHSQAVELGYFCQGLRQELLCGLAQMPGIRLLADPVQAEAMGVRAAVLVAGSVRKAGSMLRVTLQVVDGASGCLLWSGSVDGAAEDVLGVQQQAAQMVAGQVRAHGAGAPAGQSLRRPAENLAARNLYLQGRYHLSQRTEEGLGKAVEFFERALQEDPQFALAHAGLADAYALLGHYGVLAPAEMSTKAAANAATAVMLEPDSAAAQTTLAHVKACQDWDWVGAERQFRHALLLDPAYPTAHHWFASSCLAPLGRLDEALEEMRLAQTLDPVSPIIARDLAVMHLFRRDLEQALEQCDHTIELNPHFSPAFCTLG
ncbi:MAG: tetratricopeptide repeat protein, partial [Terriglobales bacterium]